MSRTMKDVHLALSLHLRETGRDSSDTFAYFRAGCQLTKERIMSLIFKHDTTLYLKIQNELDAHGNRLEFSEKLWEKLPNYLERELQKVEKAYDSE